MPHHTISQPVTVHDAASPLGDAIMTEACLARAAVTALSPTPARITRFSPEITVSPIDPASASATQQLSATLTPETIVVLTLGASVQDSLDCDADATPTDIEATTHIVRAMRESGATRLIATVPIDAFGLSIQGKPQHNEPQRHRSLVEGFQQITAAASITRKGKAGAHGRRRHLIAARRALELVRLSGLNYTIVATPLVEVAPSSADIIKMPAAFAPKTSRIVGATGAARQVLSLATNDATYGQEFVLSE